jgi:twitching motility protein PilT
MIAAERIFALVERGRERHASDVHIEPGRGAAYRIFTQIERIPNVWPESSEIEAFLEATLDRVCRARLEKIGITDAVYADERVGAMRIHASRGKSGPRVAIRLLERAIPDLDALGLPKIVETFTAFRSGLVLIVGPPGSGKSTAAAALLDRVNATSQKHILAFEDPVEFFFTWGRSIVTQYEVGRDVSTFAEGVRGALRADPDVIFIGELRDVDTVAAALQAAETGHLVFAVLHTWSETPHAINRIIGLFRSDEQESVRLRLADALRAVIGLRLIPRKDRSGLRAAAEIAIANEALRRMIRDGTGHQIRLLIASSRKDGMQTLESNLSELASCGDIDFAVARAASHYPDEVREPGAAHVRLR